MSKPRFGNGRKYDATIIRNLLSAEIKRSSLSNEQIAEEMSTRLCEPVSNHMLYKIRSAGRTDYRWPAQFDVAFCEIVGSYKLLAERVKRAGFRMIGPEEERLIEIGRAYLQKVNAEKRLSGVDL